MKKVLIVSCHFPPLNTMAAKRYGYMCKYLADYGYEPSVLTKRARSAGYLDAKLELSVPIESNKVHRIGALGVSYPIHNFLVSLVIYHMRKKGITSRILNEMDIGWYGKVKNEIDLDRYKDIDIVIGTFPEIENILVGEHIARKLNVPFIAEIRDLITDYEEGINKNYWSRKVDKYLENKILGKADGIVTVTTGFSNILTMRYPKKKVRTVYNGWEYSYAQNAKHEKLDYIYYAGSLYEHRVESLKLLFDVLKKNHIKTEVIIRSLGPEILNEKLRKYVIELGLTEQVKIKDVASEEVVLKEQDMAKINLLVSSVHEEDHALMTTLPGKLFELINVDSPVLAVVNDVAEISEILKTTDKGIATIQENKIVDFITGGYKQYQGNEKANEFSRANQAKKLCGFLDEILST